MSSIKRIHIPSQPDLNYFAQLLKTIKEEQVSYDNIEMDWSVCETIDSKVYCILLHFQDIPNVTHINLVASTNRELNTAKSLLNTRLGNATNCQIIESGIFLSPIYSQEWILQHKEDMKSFYKGFAYEFERDYGVIESIFSELYMNVCQHSSISKGYIFIAKPNEVGTCNIIFSDIGVGIVSKILSFYQRQDIENHCNTEGRPYSDAAVIEYATREGITTRSETQNQGRGLSNLKSQMQSLQGDLEIRSRFGLYKQNNSGISLEQTTCEHSGTYICLTFNFSALPPKEDIDYEGEI